MNVNDMSESLATLALWECTCKIHAYIFLASTHFSCYASAESNCPVSFSPVVFTKHKLWISFILQHLKGRWHLISPETYCGLVLTVTTAVFIHRLFCSVLPCLSCYGYQINWKITNNYYQFLRATLLMTYIDFLPDNKHVGPTKKFRQEGTIQWALQI
jgi:hypothetical protein